MSKQDASKFFDKTSSESYDARARKIGAINDNLHLMIRIVLNDLPADARILCVGVGTGTEIVMLAADHPERTFVGVDPAAAMLDVARDKLVANGLQDRCTLVNGYVSDVPLGENFDAVLCLLVTHFIKDVSERQEMFDAMASRLKKGGYMITADISGDTNTAEFNNIFEKWKTMHQFAGAPADKLAKIQDDLQKHVSVLPPAAIEAFYRNSGFACPVRLCQSLLITAWYAQK